MKSKNWRSGQWPFCIVFVLGLIAIWIASNIEDGRKAEKAIAWAENAPLRAKGEARRKAEKDRMEAKRIKELGEAWASYFHSGAIVDSYKRDQAERKATLDHERALERTRAGAPRIVIERTTP